MLAGPPESSACLIHTVSSRNCAAQPRNRPHYGPPTRICLLCNPSLEQPWETDNSTTGHFRTKTLTPVGLPGWSLEVEVACLGRCQLLSDSATCLSPFRDQSGMGYPLHHPGRLMNRQARLARERQVPCRRTTDRACSALDEHRSSRMTMHSQPSSGSAAQASSIFRPQRTASTTAERYVLSLPVCCSSCS